MFEQFIGLGVDDPPVLQGSGSGSGLCGKLMRERRMQASKIRLTSQIWLYSSGSVAPRYATTPKPEMRAAAGAAPYRRVQSRQMCCINPQVPPGLCLTNEHEFDRIAAAAGTKHTDGPVFAIVSQKNEGALGKPERKRVPFDNEQLSRRTRGVPSSSYPANRTMRCAAQIFEEVHHAATFLGHRSEGMPSRGSASPCATIEFGATGNASSAV